LPKKARENDGSKRRKRKGKKNSEEQKGTGAQQSKIEIGGIH